MLQKKNLHPMAVGKCLHLMLNGLLMRREQKGDVAKRESEKMCLLLCLPGRKISCCNVMAISIHYNHYYHH